MNSLMLTLKEKFPFLEKAWCQWLIGLVVFLNPIAMIPQLVIAATGSVEQVHGISIFTYLIFVSIQLAVSASAIRALDWKLFGSMILSVVESLAIVLVVFIRS